MENLKQKVKENENVLVKVLNDKSKYGFTPNSDFYTKVNIKRKRYAMLVRGEAEITVTEFKIICNFFDADIKDYL